MLWKNDLNHISMVAKDPHKGRACIWSIQLILDDAADAGNADFTHVWVSSDQVLHLDQCLCNDFLISILQEANEAFNNPTHIRHLSTNNTAKNVTRE